MRPRLAPVLVLVVALGVIGCRPTPMASARSVPPQFDLLAMRVEADARLVGGDLDGAVSAFTAVLAHQPDDVAARYRLGVALSRLDRDQEAVAAFEWVVNHGPADAEEVRIARRWLAGIVAPDDDGADPAAAPVPDEARGRLEGQSVWADLDGDDAVPTLQIVLDGAGPTTRGKRYATRVKLGEHYRIDRIEPGDYRLIAHVGPVRLWETTVMVTTGGTTTLDLTPADATAPRDVLRPPAS